MSLVEHSIFFTVAEIGKEVFCLKKNWARSPCSKWGKGLSWVWCSAISFLNNPTFWWFFPLSPDIALPLVLRTVEKSSWNWPTCCCLSLRFSGNYHLHNLSHNSLFDLHRLILVDIVLRRHGVVQLPPKHPLQSLSLFISIDINKKTSAPQCNCIDFMLACAHIFEACTLHTLNPPFVLGRSFYGNFIYCKAINRKN